MSATAREAPAYDTPVEPLDFPERLGDFHLIRRLGSGGTGFVFLARQESLSRDVALKVVASSHFADAEARTRFRREVETIARLAHPGIVPVYGVGEEGDVLWIAMEVVEGCTLAEVLAELRSSGRERSAAAVAEAVRQISRRKASRTSDAAAREVFAGSWVQGCARIVRDVARALDPAHRAGVVHRDVNPSNILIDTRGRVRLVDFGLASAHGLERLPPRGALGSLPYQAPEQLRRDAAAIGARTDVYSLGVTLYELLSLELPYHDPQPQRARALALEADPLPLHDLLPGIPWDVETVCLTAMERDPRRRYATAEAFARDLENLLFARPIEARRPGAALRTRRWIGRHRTIALAVASMLLLATGAPALLLLDAKAEREQLQMSNRLLQQQLDLTRAELDTARARAADRQSPTPRK